MDLCLSQEVLVWGHQSAELGDLLQEEDPQPEVSQSEGAPPQEAHQGQQEEQTGGGVDPALFLQAILLL